MNNQFAAALALQPAMLKLIAAFNMMGANYTLYLIFTMLSDMQMTCYNLVDEARRQEPLKLIVNR